MRSWNIRVVTEVNATPWPVWGDKKNKRLKYVFETELKAGQQQFLQVNYNICSLRTFALYTF